MRLAPEGLPFVLVGFGILVGVVVAARALGGAWWLGPILWTPIAIWIPLFFRDPQRTTPDQPGLVVAPADGRIVGIEDLEEPDYIAGPATRVSVFMNVFSVHVNRHPVTGVVEYSNYRPGRFLNATLDKASVYNERMSLGVRSPDGRVLIRQIAGLVARRIVTDHVPGDSVQRGQRLGLIRFGSRVDTYLPKGTTIRVRLGDQAVAGETILAEWPQ